MYCMTPEKSSLMLRIEKSTHLALKDEAYERRIAVSKIIRSMLDAHVNRQLGTAAAELATFIDAWQKHHTLSDDQVIAEGPDSTTDLTWRSLRLIGAYIAEVTAATSVPDEA
jgi:hypothetical protein